jgi:hypothetical protein
MGLSRRSDGQTVKCLSWCLPTVLGPLLVIGSIVVLLRNERSLHTDSASLQEGMSIVSSLPDADTIDTSLNGQLVHVSGMAAAQSQIKDDRFGVQEDALKFRRNVEMYQWIEEKLREDSFRPKYSVEWRKMGVDSSKFEQSRDHHNPPFPKFQGYETTADLITLGAFTLDSSVTSKINGYENITSIYSVDTILDPPMVTNKTIHLLGNRGYYIGGEGKFVEVGDIRVTFQTIPYQNISIIGRQSDSGFSTFVTPNDGQILLVERGSVSAEDMFIHAKQDLEEASASVQPLFFFLLAIGAAMCLVGGCYLLLAKCSRQPSSTQHAPVPNDWV